jgi:murein L,D-transpeptidase YcbB/YkuD
MRRKPLRHIAVRLMTYVGIIVPRAGVLLVGLSLLLAPCSTSWALNEPTPAAETELQVPAGQAEAQIGSASSAADLPAVSANAVAPEGNTPSLEPRHASQADTALPAQGLTPATEIPTSAAPVVAETAPDHLPAPEVPPAAPTLTAAELLSGALEARLRDTKAAPLPPRLIRREREAVAAYYASAHFQPAWIADGAWTSRAKDLIERLKHADEDGLDPADYPVPLIGTGPDGRAETPADLAEAEVKLSAAAALYARDARGGRIDPARISGLITPKLDLPAADAVLARLAAASEPGVALQSYNPAYPGYRALKAKLAELRANRPAQPMVSAPKGPAYSSRLIASLEGIVPPPRLEGDILANMERWRWLPSEVSRRYIFVNIPEFRLELIEDGKVVHQARVITGKPGSPTPVFSGVMDHAIVNPSWYIPPSIMKNEILPGLAADPTYAEQRGYEVVRRGNQITVRQPPGERNALGFIKFMFPNQHAVYLHDTPNRKLFAAANRAFSHGCVRVDQPFRLAEFLLGKEWSEPRLRKLIGGGERTIRLSEKLPVHLAYMTMTVDAAGQIRILDDLYGYNRRVRAALGLGA